MKKMLGVVLVLAFVACAMCFSSAVFAAGQEYSADMVSSGKDMPGTFTGKIFVGKDKMRMETGPSVVITRADKKLVWTLLPEQKMYVEMPMGQDTQMPASEKMPGEIERKSMGTETVNGKVCDKYRIRYKMAGTEKTVYSWIAKDMKVAMRTESEDGSFVIEYKNLKVGPQPASLFEVPAGYQKMSYTMPMQGEN